MDQHTQQNAAMVKESTAASHSLAQQAASLRELVSQFRIGQHSSHKVMEARPDASPVASPARKLMASVARAAGGAAAAKVQEGWEDF